MTLQDYDAVAARIPYRPKGIFYSEIFFFLDMCAAAGVSLIVESGVKYGFSTALLSAGCAVPIISIDRAITIPAPPRVTFIQGDAVQHLPRVIRRHARERIGVLIDGPKGRLARQLKDACLRSPAVRLVAIHSARRGGDHTWHSQNPEGLKYRPSDRFVSAPFRAAYPNAPGLGVWMQA